LLTSLLQTARRAICLSRRERAQAARALAWLLLARLAVRGLPYARVRRAIARIRPRPSTNPMTSLECARAIQRAASILPATRCLARGLAAEGLLRRDGRSPTLTLGVGFDESRVLQAHAWLESDGVIVTGREEAARYAPLAPRSSS
jgi:hypothetical protein